MAKVIITEDNLFSQKALEQKLSAYPDIILKNVTRNGEELMVILEDNHVADVILMDLEMPVMNGIQATERVKRNYPQIKIIMITVFDDDESIFDAIKAGADSYILKDTGGEKIYETIQDTLVGGAVMSPSIAAKALKFLKNAEKPEIRKETEEFNLSDREIEVLEQISCGLKNKTIAENLFISPFTVKNHIEKIYKKLQARNRIELVQKARQNRII